MKKLGLAVFLMAVTGSHAQWIKCNAEKLGKTDIAYYIEKGDTIAKKWTETESGERFVTSISRKDYCEVWKMNDFNYLSVLLDNPDIKTETDKYYNVRILMDSNLCITDLAYVRKSTKGTEFVLSVNSQEIDMLKTDSIKEIEIENTGEKYILDSRENNLDVNFIKKSAGIIWPDKKVLTNKT